MNTRSTYPDVQVPEISPPRFILDRGDERGTAVPLMGPADPGAASPLMGPAAAGTVTPLMGPAVPATVTPLMGPAIADDDLTHGYRRPGHGHAADVPQAGNASRRLRTPFSICLILTNRTRRHSQNPSPSDRDGPPKTMTGLFSTAQCKGET